MTAGQGDRGGQRHAGGCTCMLCSYGPEAVYRMRSGADWSRTPRSNSVADRATALRHIAAIRAQLRPGERPSAISGATAPFTASEQRAAHG